MYKEGEKEQFIKILEELTAIVEHNPGETIKTAMIEGIKAKTKVLRDKAKEEKRKAYIKEGTEIFQEIEQEFIKRWMKEEEITIYKYFPPFKLYYNKVKPTTDEEQPEVLRFGNYIKRLSFGTLEAKTIEQHYEEFTKVEEKKSDI